MGLASFGSDHPQELLLHEDLFYELNGEYVSKSNPYQFVRKLMEHLKIDENVMIEDLNFYDKQFDNCATIAKRIQDETKKHTIRLIQKSIDLTGSKNIVLSGGYFLNCVNNYQYLNHFPDINFYIDPISYDGGTAIGAAKWFWHGLTGDKTIRKLNTLYLG
jgi:predicted NodU family carbamoyl transferase